MYKDLAKHGRFGDTEMYRTSKTGPGKGELWHVNPQEKKIMDMYGQRGEKLVDLIGSGTINPKTGKEEKWIQLAIMAAGLGVGLMESYGQTRAIREQGQDQIGILDEGIASLRQAGSSLQDSLGASLQVATEKAKRVYTAGAEKFSEGIGQIRKSKDAMSEKTGFASTQDDDTAIELYRKEAKRKLEDVDIGLTETLDDILSTHEKQKFDNQMQIQQMENQRKLAERQSKTKYFGIF
tara:strand:- start:343 stop:1053 length:711 start_codon:yes stop_codon:yes gene_type:complete